MTNKIPTLPAAISTPAVQIDVPLSLNVTACCAEIDGRYALGSILVMPDPANHECSFLVATDGRALTITRLVSSSWSSDLKPGLIPAGAWPKSDEYGLELRRVFIDNRGCSRKSDEDSDAEIWYPRAEPDAAFPPVQAAMPSEEALADPSSYSPYFVNPNLLARAFNAVHDHDVNGAFPVVFMPNKPQTRPCVIVGSRGVACVMPLNPGTNDASVAKLVTMAISEYKAAREAMRGVGRAAKTPGVNPQLHLVGTSTGSDAGKQSDSAGSDVKTDAPRDEQIAPAHGPVDCEVKP